ncbi:MAG: XrtA/PEP-CTERM system TPR-repeat protein PrsT, partial [Pseudomonadota bacterium]
AVGDYDSAEYELRRARELGHDVVPTSLPLAEALVLQGHGEQALGELAALPNASAEALALSGLAHEIQGHASQSLAAYEAALALDAAQERALLGMARSALAELDRPRAEDWFEAALAAHGDSPRVRLDYGRYLYDLGRFEDAVGQYEIPLDLPILDAHLPLRWDVHLGLAEAQLALGRLDAADATIDILQQVQPDHTLVKYLRARSAFERKDLAVADDLVKRVILEAPTFGPGQILQATIHLARSEFEQARLLLERWAVEGSSDAQVRRLLAAARRGSETQTGTRRAPVELSEEEMMSLLGAANARIGDYLGAISLWERALRQNPDDEEMRLDLISAYVLSRRLDDAQGILDAASWRVAENAERAATLNVMVSLLGNELGIARRKAMTSIERFAQSAELTSLQGLIELDADQALAERYFERALDLDAGHTTSIINLANIAIAAGDTGRAVERLSAFVNANPRDIRALDALGRAQRQAGDTPGALATLEAARALAPGAVSARLQLVEVLASEGAYLEAEEVARELVAARPTLWSAHNSLGVALVGQGKLQEGIAGLRTARRLNDSAIEPLRNLARAEYANGDLTQALLSIDALLRVSNDDVVALDLATRVAIDQGREADAERFLARLIDASAKDPDSRLLHRILAGDIAMLRGEPANALGAYEAVFAERPSTTLVMRLYRARQRLGDARALQGLRDWLAQHPDDKTVRLTAAMHAHSDGAIIEAAADYEHLLRLDRNHAVAWNNLAWAYSALGDTRALRASRRAFDLSRENPTMQDTYGWMLIEDDQLDNGISILRDAWAAAPGDGEIGYHLAAGLARAGEREEARAILADALAREAAFGARDDAERLLREL